MAVAATLRAVLGLDTAEYERGFARATQTADRWGSRMDSLAQGVAQGFGQRIADGIMRVVGVLNQAVQAADQMGKLAQKVGIATESLSSLSYAATLADVGRAQLQTGLTQLNKKIAEAAGGNEKVAAMFDRIGVAATDAAGRARPTEAVFADLAERFASFEDGPTKSAAALAIFGKAGANLLPLLNEGKEGLAELREEAEKYGLVISEKTARAADEFGDKLDKLSLIGQGFLNKVVEKLLPFLNRMADLLIDNATSAAQANTGVDAFVRTITALINGVSIAVSVVQLLFEGFKAIAGVLPGIGSIVKTTVVANFERLGLFMKAATDDTYSLADAVADGQKVMSSAANDVRKDLASIETAAFDGVSGVAKAVDTLRLKFSDLVDGGGSTGPMEFGRQIAKTQAPVLAVGDAAAASAKQLDKLIDKFSQLGANAELTDERASQLGTALARAFASGDTVRAQKIVKIIEQLAEQTNRIVAQKSLEKFRNQVDQLIDRVTQLNIDPFKADMLALQVALEDAFSRGDTESVEKLTAAIVEFGKQTEKANLAAKGFFDIDEIAARSADNVRNIWTGVFDDLASQIAQFIGSGGEGGLGGLLTGLAQTLSGGSSSRLGNAISTGFDIKRGGGSGQQALDGFENAGGFQALGEIAGQQLGAIAGGSGTGAQIGAALGTAIGAYFGGAFGAAIGGILGGLVGGLFDEDASPRLTVSGRAFPGAEGTARTPFGVVNTRTQDINTPGQEVADAIATFDRTIADLLSPEQIQRASAALAGFFEIYKNASASLETALSTRFNIIVSTLDARVRAFVGTTGTLEERVERLNEALQVLERAEDGLFRNMLGTGVENALGGLQDARDDANEALNRIGLAAGTTREQLEAAFNNGQGLSVEQIKLWIEAADKLNAVNEAQEAYNAALEKQRMAVQSYNDFIAGFREEAAGLSEFQSGLRGLARATRDAVDQANALARAAGLQGAREEDLALIHEAAAMRAARAARELEAASRSLAEQLYGPMDEIGASASFAASSLTSAADALDRARQGLTDFADDLLIGDNSPLAGRDKLAKAMELLTDASSRGDVQRVQQLADATLGIGRDVFASGRDFNELFDRVQAIIRGTIPAIEDGGGLGGAGGDFAASANVLSAAQRYELAAQLAQNIADLSDFSGDGFDVVADRLGVDLTRLAADLQIAPDAVTAFLESLKPPEGIDDPSLDPAFGQVADIIREGSDDVVEAVVESGDEVVSEISSGNETRDEIRDLQREGNTLFRRMIAILESQEGRGVRS